MVVTNLDTIFKSLVVPFEASQQIFQPKMLQASKLQD